MKTEEEILEHLKVTGYAQNSRFVIAGFLIGKNITTVDENIEIRVGDGRAGDFIKWFESEEVVKPKFKVGDWVRVTDTRQTHDTHSIAFKAMNFKNKDKNPIVENDSVGQIFGMYYCNLNRCYIYGIQFGDKQCAMNDGGFVAYYPKEGEFFYVKKYNNYEFILCDTKNKKLALAFAIISNKLEYDEYDGNTYFHDLFENLKNQYNINEVIGEYEHAWDEDDQLSEIIDIIDKNKIVQSKYESNG